MDEKISELVRVRTWDDYVGQHTLKKHLDIKIRAAVNEDRLFDHTLLIGPPGSGKSTIVRLIAGRLHDELLYLPMPMRTDDFLYAIETFCGGIVFLDEIHNAPRAFQEMLQFGVHDGYLPGRYGEQVETNHVTFVGATTFGEQGRLLKPLVERFKYRPAWDDYTDAEMAEIVAGMALRADVEIPDEVSFGLAGAAGGNPRAVQDLVAAARDLAAVGEPITVEGVLSLAGLDVDGLNRDHVMYLRTLHDVGGTAGLSLLTSMMAMSAPIVEELERTLVLRGLVRRAPAGRKLTATGRAKIDQTGSQRRDPIAARHNRLSA